MAKRSPTHSLSSRAREALADPVGGLQLAYDQLFQSAAAFTKAGEVQTRPPATPAPDAAAQAEKDEEAARAAVAGRALANADALLLTVHTGLLAASTLAVEVLAQLLTDRTLPPGREQGTAGPLQASRTFRGAVPDLRVEVTDMVAAGDRVTVRLHFIGHFTGQFGKVQGKGQAIDFQAFDLYRVVKGRIADNWHLEDNLTLLRQMGVVQQ